MEVFSINNPRPIPTLTQGDIARFEAKYITGEELDDCWKWIAGKTSDGYGQFRIGRTVFRAHRISYTLIKGDVPNGLTLDHKCRNRSCVNPNHLETVTSSENTLRGEGAGARHKRKTHCIHGHEFSPDNTRIDGRRRICLACRYRSGKTRYERLAALGIPKSQFRMVY